MSSRSRWTSAEGSPPQRLAEIPRSLRDLGMTDNMRFSYQDTANITPGEIAALGKELTPYLSVLKSAAQDNSYGVPEACLHLPFDEQLRREIKSLAAEKKSDKLKEVMVVGIGGSSLGAQAIYQALRGNNPSVSFLRPLVPMDIGKESSQFFFYDTLNARALGEGVEQIKNITSSGGEVLVVIVSKSGTTMETIANAAILLKTLSGVDRDWQKRVIVISEPKSTLSLWAQKSEVTILPHPEQVGGRFSVMSVVGLLPLALVGIDIEELHAGARDALALCLSNVPNKNITLQSAAAIYKNLQEGKTIHDLFLFHPDLEDLGKWWRQLVAESLGKDGKGITPTVSIGSTDLHSMAQLYLDGPADKFTTFVKATSAGDWTVPVVDEKFDAIAPHITNRATNEIMTAIYQGVAGAYQKRKLPFAEIILEQLSVRELGAFMQFKMIETMLLAKLMGVNCFNQPAVEEYKVITKQILSGGGAR